MAEVKLWHTNGNAENLTLHQYLSSRPGGVKYMKHSFARQQQDLRCRDGINTCLGTMLFKSVFPGSYNGKILGYWSICLKSKFLLGVCFHHFYHFHHCQVFSPFFGLNWTAKFVELHKRQIYKSNQNFQKKVLLKYFANFTGKNLRWLATLL